MKNINHIIGLTAGGAAGSIIALLFTPQNGKELRLVIDDGKNRLFDEANKNLKRYTN